MTMPGMNVHYLPILKINWPYQQHRWDRRQRVHWECSRSLHFSKPLSTDTNSIEQPKYDTTYIEIRSTNSFSFCSRLFKIPRDCNKKNESNCCSFSSEVHLHQKLPLAGQLGCYDGTSLFWTYYESEYEAKGTFEGYSPQLRRQMKKFKENKIKLFICNQETVGFQFTYTTVEGFTGHTIVAYANVNGQPVFIRVDSPKELKSSTQMRPVFQEILQF